MAGIVKVEDAGPLPLRAHPTPQEAHASLRINPVPSRDAFVVSVDLPKQPRHGLVRTNCDIVLVIDVSGSMATSAPLPGAQDNTEAEDTGLSILDLTKHAARTILSTLKAKDRLGIVAYSTNAKVHFVFYVNDLDLELTCPADCREADIHDATGQSQHDEED